LIAWMAWRGVETPVLCAALFFRGMGMGAIGIPTIAAAYSSVPKERLPIATTTINIVQRIGGPIGTTLFAIFLGFCGQRLHLSGTSTFAAAFLLLAAIHASNFFCALRLPMRVHDREDVERLGKDPSPNPLPQDGERSKSRTPHQTSPAE
jgi:MFS family permease